jgi:hypothetical protein
MVSTITATTANIISRAGAAAFASGLIKAGITTLSSSGAAAKEFGLPATSVETLNYIPALGIRNIGFGASILALLAADHLSVIAAEGGRAAAIVTAVGACVGMGDGLLVRAAGGSGAIGHQVGASLMALSACGIWATAA